MKSIFTQHVNAPYERVKEFYADVANLKRITPPFPRLTIDANDTRVVKGKEFLLKLDFILFSFRWMSKIESVVEGEYFVDTFQGSVFAMWKHTHKYEANGSGTLLMDEIEYQPTWWFMPFAPLAVKGLFLFRKGAIAKVFG